MTDTTNNLEPLSIEKVLYEEVKAFGVERFPAAAPAESELADQKEQRRRTFLNADDHEDDITAGEVRHRESFYRWLNSLNRAALCCSGGGIRSATFCLGVIQALAGHDLRRSPRLPQRAAEAAPGHGSASIERQTLVAAATDDGSMQIEVVREQWMTEEPSARKTASAEPDQPPPSPRAEETAAERSAKAANSLLGRFHYLSTVSGGGYIGSWLSSWRARDSFENVISGLSGRPEGADVEPPEISWLRAYSNYLTPHAGIGSADTWAALAIVVRNLLLNWLIIIPVVCCALIVLKIIATVSVVVAQGEDDGWLVVAILLYGIACLIAAQAFTTRHRPPRQPIAPRQRMAPRPPQTPSESDVKCSICGRTDRAENCCSYLLRSASEIHAVPHRTSIDDTCFIYRDLILAVLSAIALTIFFASAHFSWLLGKISAFLAGTWFNHWFITPLGLTGAVGIPALTAAAGFFVYLLGWLAGRTKFDRGDCLLWAASGLIYGALVGVGAYLFGLLDPADCPGATTKCLSPLLVAVVFGVPWVLLSQLLADTVFGGLVSYERLSDSDREWLGRAAGWLAAFAIGWTVLAFLVFAGGYYVQDAMHAVSKEINKEIAAAGGIAGLVTALLGKSAITPATSESKDQNTWTALAANIALAVAGPIFAAVLIVMLSVALDKLLLDDSLVELLLQESPSIGSILIWLSIGGAVSLVVARIASHKFNINRFSLHALYRNRLIRAYLGASRQKRRPDNFTGLDDKDNIRMHALWPPKSGGKVDSKSLFHVVNITLNVVSTKRLAWQERKAESFTVSPKHSGAAYLGFRNSADYGDSLTHHTPDHGIALGTAMAISGAAASPNMGYHSSPSLALLLTLFNVRLGWWLGNPGEAGNKDDAFRREGPRLAAKPLFYEAFGQTTDTSAYVYLSDGGHFENLGLYEMVRRRCRFIVVIDAGCDPTLTFFDLGNAVRKIYIDLGVRIDFAGLDKLRNKPTDAEIAAAGTGGIPYWAIGTIRYLEADGNPAGNRNIGDGYILYIKPAFHGDEAAGILAYAKANKDFPHETTVDEWFTESQLESYRSLGYEITNDILRREIVLDGTSGLMLHDLLQKLDAPQRATA